MFLFLFLRYALEDSWLDFMLMVFVNVPYDLPLLSLLSLVSEIPFLEIFRISSNLVKRLLIKMH